MVEFEVHKMCWIMYVRYTVHPKYVIETEGGGCKT